MWKCPVCANEEETASVCHVCGMEKNEDFVEFRTVYPASAADCFPHLYRAYNKLLKERKNMAAEVSEVCQKKKANPVIIRNTESVHQVCDEWELRRLSEVDRFKNAIEEMKEKVKEWESVKKDIERLDKWNRDEWCKGIVSKLENVREEPLENRYNYNGVVGCVKHDHDYEKWSDSISWAICNYVSDTLYIGGWTRDRENGSGVKCYYDESMYSGSFKDGRRDGTGIYDYADGTTYKGSWRQDKRSGYGKETYGDGSDYEGEFYNDLRHGYGIYYYGDGAYYEGHWSDGHKDGYGRETYKDGSSYEGHFSKGKRDGFGTYLSSKRDGAPLSAYEGEWKNDLKEGFGREILDGTYFEGMFAGGQRHGHGFEHYEDETVYEGEWENGERVENN